MALEIPANNIELTQAVAFDAILAGHILMLAYRDWSRRKGEVQDAP